jgi:tetratricopeptide (TPR) repeat protein
MIKFLTQDIEKTNWKSTDSVINFYERYKVYLDNLDLIKDTDDLIQALDIKLTYLFALDEKKHYTKADKNLKDISNSLKNIQDTDSFNRIYERFLFISGVISYRLKKYDESFKMFNEIKIIDPDNDLYKKKPKY